MWLVYGCFYLNRLSFASVIPLIMEDLNISHTQVGLISAFFFFFHMASQFPAGYLSDIFGPRKIIPFGGITSAIANLLFSAGSGLFYLTGIQGFNGMGQAGGFSPGIKLLNNWFQKSERARTFGIFSTSSSAFTVFAYILAGYLGKTFGWRAVFLISPVILLCVLFIFRVVVDNHPPGNGLQNHRYMTPERPEKFPGNMNKLIIILRNKDARMVCIGFFCLTYITYSNLVWLPAYLYEYHGLSVVKASLFASFYPASGILARPLGGYFSDVTFGGRRKPLLLIGLSCILVSTLLLSGAERLEWVVILFISTGFFDQLLETLFLALILDILPSDLAGAGAGLLNTGGHLGSIATMFLSGVLVDVLGSYSPVFLVLSILSAMGIAAVLFVREKKTRTQA